MTDETRSRGLRLEAADLGAAAHEAVGRANLMVPDLAGAHGVSQDEISVGNDPAADPRAERDQDEILRPRPTPYVYSPSVAQRASLPTKTGMPKCSRSFGPSGTSFHPKLGE